jgi:hypothetical protein
MPGFRIAPFVNKAAIRLDRLRIHPLVKNCPQPHRNHGGCASEHRPPRKRLDRYCHSKIFGPSETIGFLSSYSAKEWKPPTTTNPRSTQDHLAVLLAPESSGALALFTENQPPQPRSSTSIGSSAPRQ